jgi:hypothetical protein
MYFMMPSLVNLTCDRRQAAASAGDRHRFRRKLGSEYADSASRDYSAAHRRSGSYRVLPIFSESELLTC